MLTQIDTMRFLLLFLVTTSYVNSQTTTESHNDENSTKSNSSDFKSALRKASSALTNKFRHAVANELGTALFEVRSYPKPEDVQSNDEQLLQSITDKLDTKLTSAINILIDMKNVLNSTGTPSFTHPCPFNSIRKMVSIKSSEFYKLPELPTGLPKSKLSGHYKDLKIKRQYFLSHMDYATDNDCAIMAHSNLRNIYHMVVHPDPKFILFIVDTRMSSELLGYAGNIVKEIVYSLRSIDLIAFKTINGTDFFKFKDLCDSSSVADVGNATDSNKVLLRKHMIDMESSDYVVPYNKVFEDLKLIMERPALPELKLVLFLTDSKTANGDGWQKLLPFSVADRTIHFAIGSITEALPDKNIISDMPRFEESYELGHKVIKLHIDSSSSPGQVASGFICLLPMRYTEGVTAADPVWEATERDFMMPLLLATRSGVLGLDMYWSDLAEDVTYFKGTDVKRRVFVLDAKGIVLMHSYFPRPELAVEKIQFSSLEFVENYDFIAYVKKQLLTQKSGNVTVTVKNKNKLITYNWKWVRELYVVCMVSEVDKNQVNTDLSGHVYLSRSAREMLFHRLDLFPPKSGSLCRHFKQISTTDQGTVFLSPSSFQSPFSYLHDMSDGQDAVTYMQNYLAYLKGVAFGFLSNPGLKTEIQHDVTLLNSVLSYYKRHHMHGPYSKYIIRRYAVAESGVLVMFPGTVLEYDYEPVRRPWYTSALENPGQIILSPPNLDVGGAGYVVSVSFALQNLDHPAIVVSMDVTMGFLYKMLIDSLPICSLSYVKCFIMNNRGYLISHPGLMDPNGSGPIEQQHITHKESVIALDMLNHKGFVTKRLCNNFPDRTVQRFYEFNTSLPNVLSNIVSGDHCVHYYITAIAGTNAFLGVVNATCNLGVFCPCSVVNRLCLNCNRMEQNVCECPCECSSDLYHCMSSNQSKNLSDIPLCGLVSENNNHKSHYFYNFAENLKPCFDFQCESYTSHLSCLGVMGCEWCQLDTDGKTSLSAPFCTSQSTCFNGVLGAVTPYGEGTSGRVTRDDVLGTYSTIGPIAGCIVTVCLVIAVAIYCYKQNVTTASCHNLYIDGPAETWPEQDLQLSHLPSEDMHGDHSGQDKLLPAADAEAPISPYKILTGYKRPHTAGDSDHGYSTMTPHEDSEATAFSLNEPIVLLDDTNLSDISCSVSTKVTRIRQKPVDMSVTVLPCGKNSIIAPVTVHRHMEAS